MILSRDDGSGFKWTVSDDKKAELKSVYRPRWRDTWLWLLSSSVPLSQAGWIFWNQMKWAFLAGSCSHNSFFAALSSTFSEKLIDPDQRTREADRAPVPVHNVEIRLQQPAQLQRPRDLLRGLHPAVADQPGAVRGVWGPLRWDSGEDHFRSIVEVAVVIHILPLISHLILCKLWYLFDQPRANEGGGKYGRGTISRVYTMEQEISLKIELTANHQVTANQSSVLY